MVLIGLPADEGLHVIKGPDGLAGEAGSDVPPDEDGEGAGGGSEAVLAHAEEDAPGGVELAGAGEGVDEEVVGGGREGAAVEEAEVVAGAEEEGEGGLGVVAEAEEGLGEEMVGEGDAGEGELEGGLERVEGVVVADEELRQTVSQGARGRSRRRDVGVPWEFLGREGGEEAARGRRGGSAEAEHRETREDFGPKTRCDFGP